MTHTTQEIKKYHDFDEWWTDYSKISRLNKVYLSFSDVDLLREELKLSFSRGLGIAQTGTDPWEVTE